MIEDDKILINYEINKNENLIFKVPANYFEELSTLILLKIRSKNNCYSVPENYFSNLSDSVLKKVYQKNQTSMLQIKNLSTNNVFSLPQNYFTDLSSSVLQKMNKLNVNEELEQIAPILLSINKQNIYKISENYFSEQIEKKPKVKLLSIKRTSWFKYASAAAIISIFCSIIIIKSSKNNDIVVLHNKALNTDVNSNINKLSDEDLNHHLEAEKSTVFTTEKHLDIPFTNNIEAEMQYITDDEIENYFNSKS